MSGARRIKVCQVLNAYQVGGAETVALDVARGLDRGRFESFAVAVIEPRATEEPEMRRRFREAGVPAFALHHRSFRSLWTLTDLTWFLRRHRPDVVHGHNRFADYWACRCGRWAGVPHRTFTRHLVYRDMNPRQLARYRRLAAEVPMVLAVGEAVRRNCIETEGLPGAKVRTVPNGIDTRRFAPAPPERREAVRRALGVAPQEAMLLFVGRLTDAKAPGAFVELVERLRAGGVRARGFICGRGPLEPELIRATSGSGATLLGVRNDVPELFGACDLAVSTSRVEGLPLNVMEAMSAGAAFVGPDLPQIVELVAGVPELAGGLYPAPPATGPVPSELVRRWTQQVAARLADAQLLRRCGALGREIIVDRFSLARMVDAYAAIYEELVHAGRGNGIGS